MSRKKEQTFGPPTKGKMSQVKHPSPRVKQPAKPTEVTIGVPLSIIADDIYRPRRIDFNASPRQAEVMKRIYCGLRENNKTLNNGHHIDSAVDVVRWLLERVGAELK